MKTLFLLLALVSVPRGYGQAAQSQADACERPHCTVEASGAAAPSIRATDQPAPKPDRPEHTPAKPEPKPEPLSPTEFERFVQESLGKSLPVFGRSLFEGSSPLHAPASVAVPSDYVVGPEDEIVVRAWGKVEIDARLTVDRYGQVFLPRVGTLRLAGVRYGDLAATIHAAIARQFKDFELTVTLGQLRSIQVFVLGQARQPGLCTISSLSTLVNALFVCGGPSATGSLRDVQVRREGRVMAHLDLYELLLHGDKSGDVPLLAGDIVFLPEVGPQVAIEGDVNTPAIYELKGSEGLAGALSDAGGVTVLADTLRATLERVEGSAGRRVQEFALDDASMRLPLHDGDVLRIHPITPRIANAVTLRGNVIAPGRYVWHNGMHVSDLIPDRQSLVTRAFYLHQNTLSSEAVSGGSNTLHDTEINWSYAAIERLKLDDLTTELIPFALGAAVAQHGSPEDKELRPGDTIVIYSAKDMPLPEEMQARFVRVDGQVKAPGVYRIAEGETLRDVVRRAGGLAPHAYLYASQLTRESVRVAQEQRLHELMERISREVLAPANMQKLDAGGKGGDAMAELALRQAYIAKLGEIHPTGRVVLRLDPAHQALDEIPDFALMDGDHFFVPSMPNTVDILGNVYNQGAVRYVAGQRARIYLDSAGGATRDGDRNREFIIRADGTVIGRQAAHGFDRMEIYPGDAVIVPPQLRARSSSVFWANIAQVAGSLALSAVAIKALQ